MAQAVEWLAAGWGGEAPLDLANRLVVVPTRQAGRRLREALAEHASRRGQAVFPPRVMTPDALLTHGLPTGVAARIESLLAWVDVVREVDLADCRDVFPVDPPERNAAWALALGAAATAWLARTFRLRVPAAVVAGVLFVLSGTALDLIAKPYEASAIMPHLQ